MSSYRRKKVWVVSFPAVVLLAVLGIRGGWVRAANDVLILVQASVSSTGKQANLNSDEPVLSNLGRYVAFHTFATNLVPHDGSLVGFRPEHLLPVAALPDGPGRTEVTLAVDRIEYLSGDRHLYGTVSGLGEPTRVVARLPATVTIPISPGEPHDFAVARERLRFFDADTGLRRDPLKV